MVPENDLKKSFIQNEPAELNYYSLNKEMVQDHRGDMHKSTVLQSQVFNHLHIRSNKQDTELLGSSTKQSVDALLNIFKSSSRYNAMGRSSMIMERESILMRGAGSNPMSGVLSNPKASIYGGSGGRVQLDRKQLKRSNKTFACVVLNEDFKPGEGRRNGKKRAENIKDRLTDMTEKLNKKLGIPNLES